MIPGQTLLCEKGNTFSFEIDMQGDTDLTGASGSWVLAESWFDGAKVLLTKPLSISFDAGIWKASVQLNPADTLALPIGKFFHDSKVALGDGTIGHISSGTFILDTRTEPEPLECDRGDNFIFEIDVADADLTNATGTWTLAESWFDGAKIYLTKTNGSGLFIDAIAKKIVIQLLPQDTIGVPSGTLFHSCDVILNDGTIGLVASGPFILDPSVDIAVVPTTSAHAAQTLGTLGQTVALTSPRAIAIAQTLGALGQAATATVTSGGVSPAFQVDFTAISALPSQVSFARASNAMMFDSTGKLTYAPNNLLVPSNTFSSWIQDGGAGAVTGGVSDPDGGTSASTFTSSGANARLYGSVGSTANAYNVINSIWIRRRTGTGTITYWDPNNTPRDVTSSITATWTRISSTSLSGTNIYNMVILSTTGDAVDLYHAQTEYVTYETSPRAYNPTTSSAYYGSRLDHTWNGSAWVAAGLLIEEARINQVLQSNNFSDAAWTKDLGGSITSTTRTAPDGTNTASTFTGAGRIYQLVAGGGPVDWVDSIWIRRRTGTGTINMWTPTAHTVNITSQVTGTWARLSTTEAAGSAYLLLELVTAGDEIDIYGAQVELGTFATSYIPTTSAAVTRSADVVELTGTALVPFQGAAYSVVMKITDTQLSFFGAYLEVRGAASGDRATLLRQYAVDTTQVSSNRSADLNDSLQATLGSGSTTGPLQIAFGTDASGSSLAANGGTVASDALTNTRTIDATRIAGLYTGDHYSNMHCAGIALYSSRLSNADLQTKSVVGASF